MTTSVIAHHGADISAMVGDPRYGTGNKNTAGLLLVAKGLSFICPLRQKAVTFAVPAGATPPT